MNYSKSFFYSKIFVLNFLLVLVSFSCRLEVPVKEMAAAKSEITRAVEVKSEKYAPEDLKKAKDELIKSHDAMKAEDIKAAKKSAEDSLKNSKEAIAKSLPLLADDNLKDARNIYEEADMAFAEKYASEEFSLAGAKIEEAEALFSEKEYWESYLKSGEAIIHASDAKDKALSNISALEDRIKSIEEEVQNLESMGLQEYAPDEMKAIDTALTDAGDCLGKKNVKDASDKIAEAEVALEDASLKTWKGFAAAKIKAAEDAKQKLESSPSKQFYTDDLQKAGDLIEESKGLYDKDAYMESNSKSEEALEVLNSIAIAMEKKTEEGRIDEVIKDSDGKTAAASEYIVKYNPKNRDCLWRIAMYVYKDARLWPIIYVANKDQIKDPDLIFPGQKLIVPAVPANIDNLRDNVGIKEEKSEEQAEVKTEYDSDEESGNESESDGSE
ncbi:MAG: LysM peptidoglycan-binding domain-containing protein [Spirochaetes bacterium]|nr:LysM peptidoglycan-binding domain-containing protein [Spirochaetota bacterium]